MIDNLQSLSVKYPGLPKNVDLKKGYWPYFSGNTDTGLRLNNTLKTQKKIKVKIPLKIGRAVVGPIKAGKVTVSYKNDCKLIGVINLWIKDLSD